VVTSHPVQYQAPLFQRLARDPQFDLAVYYGHDGSLVGEFDADFGLPVSWDRPLLAGYRSAFLTSCRTGRRGRILTISIVNRLLSEFRWERYDAVLIHSYATASSAVGYLAAYLSRTPVLLRTESELIRPRSGWRNRIRRFFVRVVVRFTSGFLVIGAANREFYHSLRIPENRLFDTPYAVDNEFFSSARSDVLSERQRVKGELGFPPELPVVVFSGKFIERKRPLDLAEAVRRLLREGIQVGLLMIGEGELRARIERFVTDERLPFVHLTGFVNQTGLAKYYALGDVFVLPSQFETWGLVVNEAMLFAMPAIVTDMVGAGRDLTEPGVTGYVYPVGNIDALTGHLRTLIIDPDRRRRMGDAAKAKILTWSFDEDLSGILAALREVSRPRVRSST
jgi:glycosyltransferase involved in cell wall biosynthesis